MKFMIEMDTSETSLAVSNGTLTALIAGLSLPKMQVAQDTTRVASQQAPAAPQTAPAEDTTQGVDVEKAAAKAKAEAAKRAAAAAAKKVAEQTPDEEEATEAFTPEMQETVPVTLEDVRAVLARANKAGKTAEAKALLAKFKVARLTELPPAKYAAMLAEAEKL